MRQFINKKFQNKMKSKEQLKQEFKNLQKPDENDFSELIESYFHKDEPITLEELLQLKTNLATIDKTNDGVETLGNVDTKEQVNAKINFAINALKANAPETYDTLKEIADYIAGDTNAEAALLQLINTKLDKPILDNNNVGRWNTSIGNFVNGVIQDDGSKIGIGVTPNTTTTSAQLNFKSSDRKVMNIPKTNFISSYSNGQPSQNQQQGDVYNNGDNIFWLRSNSNRDRWKKLTGFDIDYIGQLPTDFNSLKTTYSDSAVNSNYDILDKYGYANIWTSDYLYGNTLLTAKPTILNADPRMYEGVLTNINLGIFWYNGSVQQYQDIKGNLFLRGVNGWTGYGETDWKKVLTDNNNKSTTLGSETNYPFAKLAIEGNDKNKRDSSLNIIDEWKGVKMPSGTKAQRDKIPVNVQAVGLMFYVTDNIGNCKGLNIYTGTNWIVANSNAKNFSLSLNVSTLRQNNSTGVSNPITESQFQQWITNGKTTTSGSTTNNTNVTINNFDVTGINSSNNTISCDITFLESSKTLELTGVSLSSINLEIPATLSTINLKDNSLTSDSYYLWEDKLRNIPTAPSGASIDFTNNIDSPINRNIENLLKSKGWNVIDNTPKTFKIIFDPAKLKTKEGHPLTLSSASDLLQLNYKGSVNLAIRGFKKVGTNTIEGDLKGYYSVSNGTMNLSNLGLSYFELSCPWNSLMTKIDLSNNSFNADSYQSMESWANNLPTMAGKTMVFTGNSASITGTNLESIFVSKGITIIS